jgi:SAM-dependent methyltransferase
MQAGRLRYGNHAMKKTGLVASLFAAALLAAAPLATAAEYQPQPYQEGKDVIWLPTPQEFVDKMLDMAQVGDKDYVIDLGSGDGRLVITAAKRGARGLGIEYNPDMVDYSNQAAEKARVEERAKFVKADIFESDFSQATVVTMYLLSSLNLKLRPKILDLKAGTRVVSHAFDMADWQADSIESTAGRTAYLWIVPAKAAGSWQSTLGELTLTQNFQMLEGALKSGTGTVPISNGRLRGDQISFSAGLSDFTGRISGNRIEGTVKGAASGAWSATLRSDNPVSSPKNP